MHLVNTFLINQGFNEKDIKVYLDIFQHGQSFASTIALRTKLDRTTVYSVLKRLVGSGIIAQTKIEGVSAYLPLAPDVFLSKIDQDISELEARRKVTNTFIEHLQGLQKYNYDRPRIQIYEGEEAIIGLYEQSLKNNGHQKAFLTLEHLPQKVRAYLLGPFIKAKIKNNVHSQVLIADSTISQKYKRLDDKMNRQTKIIKKHPFGLKSEIILFSNNEVAIIDFHKQPYGIVIQSQTLYQTIETLFDCLWENC